MRRVEMGSGEQFNSDWRVLKTMESHGGDLGIALGGGATGEGSEAGAHRQVIFQGMGVAAETAVAVEAEPQLSRRQRQAARRAAEAVVQEPIVEPSSASEKGADNPFHGQSVPRDRVMKRLHLKPGEADTAALQAGYELVGKNYRKIEEKKS